MSHQCHCAVARQKIMNVVFLTAGTGSYYCGACMRDNALARELQRMGHEVTIAPLYLPLILDEPALAGAEQVPVFFGGINVFLQQKLAFFRHTPAAFDRLLNSTGLLKWAARHSHMTSARDHGEMTLEMLQIDASRLRKELENLMTWLEKIEKPDLVGLANALLDGVAGGVKQRNGSPVVVFFPGADLFLDGLPEPFLSRCWSDLAPLPTPLPSLIVDVGSEYAALIDRLLAGDEDADTKLLHAGQHAMPAILVSFPGTLKVDVAAPPPTGLPRASECGNLLRLVARQRRVALPYLLTGVDERDIDRRFWATYLLSALPDIATHEPSLPALSDPAA